MCGRRIDNDSCGIAPWGHSADAGLRAMAEDTDTETVWEARRDGWPRLPGDARSGADIDYGRIIHCASFRRLQGKTQVLNLGDSDFYRNRLTHSLEVAQIAT